LLAGLPCFGSVATPSPASYRRAIAVRERKHAPLAFGNGSTNDARFSQTSDKAKTRQPSHAPRALHVLLNSYLNFLVFAMENMMTMVVKIDARGKITIPKSILRALKISQGDYVQVDVESGQATLKPRKLIDPTQSWFWSPEWQEKESIVEKEVSQQELSPAFHSVHESLEWLKK
jgi:AbrB family looped-hinge helix DNA binding protein